MKPLPVWIHGARTNLGFPECRADVHRKGPVVHLGSPVVNDRYAFAMSMALAESASVGIDQLTNGGQIAPQLLVFLRLAVDLVARVENGRVVAPAKLLADTQQ